MILNLRLKAVNALPQAALNATASSIDRQQRIVLSAGCKQGGFAVVAWVVAVAGTSETAVASRVAARSGKRATRKGADGRLGAGGLLAFGWAAGRRFSQQLAARLTYCYYLADTLAHLPNI